ncbi:TetR/AcrR family transcriptional regulator [Catenuloplanes atrovinosus]|uniref:AcrR family transcriptional regulator n=1 Tax=Catenuloplanes atrovinosus TaxID=137266 RepID=A0AAE4CAK6_9ACTN|nr:TetR/AcrR family transcriptional regulator [Catenuloplanes atrovinosus]MDR7277092.1 AcrR family transcriptional regulator [Catenuloplanes atrovinosus]
MKAAWQELAEHGTAGLSLRAVARRAGVSHAAPKHHFADRAGLLTALAVEGYAALVERFRTVLDPLSDPVEIIEALGRTYLDFGLTRPDMFEVMYGTEPLRADDPELAAARAYVMSLLSGAVAGVRADRSADGGRPITDPSLMTWAFIHGLTQIARDGSLRRVTGSPGPAETAARAHHLIATFIAWLRLAEHRA